MVFKVVFFYSHLFSEQLFVSNNALHVMMEETATANPGHCDIVEHACHCGFSRWVPLKKYEEFICFVSSAEKDQLKDGG